MTVEEHFLLKHFMAASGEVVNPYHVLQVPRDANRADIKGSAKQLAKRYHPDGARNRTILPAKWYIHTYDTLDGKTGYQNVNPSHFLIPLFVSAQID